MSKSKKQMYLEMSNSALNKAVLVQGTRYDRRLQWTPEFTRNIQRRYANGTDVKVIAKDANVSVRDVLYHVDDEFKVNYNKLRKLYANNSGPSDKNELAEYKRSLISEGKKLITK